MAQSTPQVSPEKFPIGQRVNLPGISWSRLRWREFGSSAQAMNAAFG